MFSLIYLYDLYIQTISQFKGLYLVLRGLAKIASKNAQHQFTLYITFILYKNMNSSNIKNKKDSLKYVSHYMHKTISSYCI